MELKRKNINMEITNIKNLLERLQRGHQTSRNTDYNGNKIQPNKRDNINGFESTDIGY